MTRKEFLNLRFPILPYLDFKRGPSTSFNESFHVQNKNENLTLNFWFRHDEVISVSFYNGNVLEERNRAKLVVDRVKNLNNNEVEDLIKKYCMKSLDTH